MESKSNLKHIPEVDVKFWMKSLNLVGSEVKLEPNSSPHGTFAVILSLLKNPKNPPNNNRFSCILAIWGEAHHDCISLYFVARPYADGTPYIHMKFKEWRPERCMAAILSILAYHVEKPRLPRKFSLANEWLRKMRDRIVRYFYQHGDSFDRRGIDPIVIESERLCFRLFNSLAGLDVKESMDRVRKEFRLLTEHASEDDIIAMWREASVEKVLRT